MQPDETTTRENKVKNEVFFPRAWPINFFYFFIIKYYFIKLLYKFILIKIKNLLTKSQIFQTQEILRF